MNVSVVDLSASQKKLQVEIPAPKVQQALEHRYRDVAKQVRIKGFRPGKVPRNIIKNYYGKTIENEVSSQFIQDSFPEALREADLKPLAEANISEMNFEDSGAFTYVAIVDVAPPFEVSGYKELVLERPEIQIGDDQVDSELERLRQQHAQLRTVEAERPVQENDVAMVDFLPYVEDQAFEKGRTTDFMVEIGKNTIHPDFDAKLLGHMPGDSFSFELDYPEDAPTPEIAGKRVRFELTVKEIKEKILPELDDEFAQEAGKVDTLDALKQQIRERLEKREEERISSSLHQQIMDKVLASVDFELPEKAVDREVDRMISMLQYQFESQGLKLDTSKFDTPAIRNEYRPQAERTVRWRLVVQKIAQMEGLEVTEDDLNEIYTQVARMARVDIDRVKAEYADSSIVEEARENKIQEKVFKLIEEAATYQAVSSETASEE